MDALHQGLGIGLSRKLDEPGPQVLLQRPATQRGTGGQFITSLVGNIPDCDRRSATPVSGRLERASFTIMELGSGPAGRIIG